MNLPFLPLLCVACLAMVGCSQAGMGGPEDDEPESSTTGGDPGGSGEGGGSGTSTGPGTGSGAHGPAVGGTVGIVVIDVQEAFVNTGSGDMSGIVARIGSDFQLAADQGVPFFITFEDSKQGDHALHAPLQQLLPGQAQDFIKTTFDATGQPGFHQAVADAGLSHLVVVGAETDVCVLQTVLGLRQMGFTVLLQQDAVFTEETNTSPALRRMQQAGALLVDQPTVAGWVAKPSELPKGPDAAVTITSPLHLGVVLNDFTTSSVSASGDPLKTQKSARLRELLLVSEWFDLPVYVADVGDGLPSSLAQYYQGQLRPISQIGQDSSVEQLVFAGTDGGVADAISAWTGSRHVFVMEDALLALGSQNAQKAMLKPLYDAGLVPTTYKSFYYDMTKSVDLAQWPSQTWVQKFDEFYDITAAPEDLPPMPAD